jgi:soluble lytic murein transglycosylase-like protein
MITSKPAGAFLLAITGCFLASEVAADSGTGADSPYRLTISTDAFRLAAPDPQVPSAAGVTTAETLQGKPYAALIQDAAREAALEPALVHAVIAIESGYNPAARSHKGAIGLMQLMPETALRYGVKDPAKSVNDNLKAGTLYLKDLMRLFNNRLELVLAAYNAGENAVIKHGGRIPPYRETQRYVPAVLSKYRELRETPQPPVSAPRFAYLPGTRLDARLIHPEQTVP